MKGAPRVAGLGQSSLDIIASVRAFPAEDAKAEASSVTIQGGGPVATALVALSRLGVKTYFMGVVSDDMTGREIAAGLGQEGVDIRGLRRRPGGSSQAALIIANRRNGSRTIVWQRPTVGELGPDEVDARLIRRARLLLLDGLMKDASIEASRVARGSGVPVMLDAGRVRSGMLRLAAGADYIVASEEFAREFSGTPRKALREISLLRPKAATVTLGARGSITWSEGVTFTRRAYRVRAVDTTGAGDVFHGGYIYGVINGWAIEKTVDFASAFAALKCRRPGGRTGIPGLDETLKLLGSRRR
jgi:ribokinase